MYTYICLYVYPPGEHIFELYLLSYFHQEVPSICLLASIFESLQHSTNNSLVSALQCFYAAALRVYYLNMLPFYANHFNEVCAFGFREQCIIICTIIFISSPLSSRSVIRMPLPLTLPLGRVIIVVPCGILQLYYVLVYHEFQFYDLLHFYIY